MNPGRRAFVLSLVGGAALQAPGRSLFAQAPPKPVTWSASLETAPGVLRPGGRFKVVVTAKIEKGWHVYGSEEVRNGPRPLRISLVPGQPFTAGALEAPEPGREHDAAFDQVTNFYSKPAAFTLPVAISPDASPGKYDVALEVRFQACDGRICLPGRSVKLAVPVTVAAGTRP